MPSKELKEKVDSYDAYILENGVTEEAVNAYVMAAQAALGEEDTEYGLKVSARAKELVEKFILNKTGGTFDQLELYAFENKQKYDIIEKYYDVMRAEAYYHLDSYCLYVEKDREPKERFYKPRRKTLKQVVDVLQELEDDKTDELFVHMPARVGKSQIITMATAWHCARHDEHSNLYVTYKEGLGGAFLDGVMEIWTDPMYCHKDVFPLCTIARTDAKNHKVDLARKKKYASLSGKGLESGLNGEYDCYGWLIIDDILEGIQDVLNPDILHRKQIVFDNNVMKRKKEKCKVIYNGTIWSLHDIYMDRLNFLENNPEAKDIRYKVLKIPALDPVTDESNFDYDYGVGFTTQYYRRERAKFEENDDIAGWLSQCQQEPIERDGAVFNPEHMRFFNGVLPEEEPLKVVAACDVALGGKDFLSMPIAFVYEDGSIYVPDVVFSAEEKTITQPEVIEKIIKYNVNSAFFEANAGGEGYKDDIDRLLKEHKEFNGGRGINLVSAYAQTDKRKEQRIWDNAQTIREIYFLDTGYRSKEYRMFMTNLYSFTINGRNKHDDAPDSLASLCEFIFNGSGVKVATVIRGGLFR